VANLLSRILGLVRPALIRLVDDTGDQQRVQLNLSVGAPDGIEEVIDHVPKVGHYGFAYRPPDGSEAITVFIGGQRSAGVVIATGHRASRPKNLLPGEAMLYNGLTGDFVRMCQDGKIRSQGDWEHTGKFHASDAITSEADITDHTAADDTSGVSMKKHRDAYNGHNHADPQGGVVGAANPQATP
jgi:phage gp45-like